MKDEYCLLSIYYHDNIMGSHKCLIIGKKFAVIHFIQQVTIATIQPVKSTLILALSAYNSKMSSVTPIFYYQIMINMIRYNDDCDSN